MDNPLIKTLKRYATLTAEDIEIINAQVTFRHLNKGELFLEEGKSSREIGFILSGVFRFFTIDKKGEEATMLFLEEGGLLIDLNSFHDEVPSVGSLQAETAADLIVISKASWQQFGTLLKNWDYIVKQISQEALVCDLRFHRKMINQDALQSYQDFLVQYPTIAQRVPDHHLASFMGITKHSLSRIRKKIAVKGRS